MTSTAPASHCSSSGRDADRPPSSRPVLRPVLRPGVHVLRRARDELQVGLDPGRAVVLPDREPYASTLAAISSPASPAEARRYDDEVLALLRGAGLLVEIDPLLRLMPATAEAEGVAAQARAGDVAALASRVGDDAGAVLPRRARAVEVLHCGGDQAAWVAGLVTSHLDRAGCSSGVSEADGPRGTGSTGRADRAGRAGSSTPASGDVGVLVVVGEPPRETVNRWTREGTPHAVLRITEGHALLGPFVVPGSTACLRCVDAHLTDVDPGRPLLVLQYAAACAAGREDMLPEPCDPVLAALAAAWTSRDVLTHLEGGSPSTASGTVRLGPELATLETQTWARHPGCGCAWG